MSVSRSAEEPEIAPTAAMGRAAIRGAGWSTLAGASMKVVGLVVQFVLGWLLVPADFAVYGLALSLTVFTSAMTDGGVQKLLRQQPLRYRELVGPATIVALAFGGLSAAILAVLGLVSPWIFGVDGVAPIAIVLAANVAVNAPVAVMRSKLQIDLRFRDASILESVLTLVRGSLTVALAFAGFGALSFAIPFIVGTLVEGAILVRMGAGAGLSVRGATASSVWKVIRATRWIMLAAACGALVLRGDYLVIGIVAESVLADYFFGFQLVASAMLLFTGAAYTVLLPVLARVTHDAVRLLDASRRSIRLGSFVIAPASAATFLVAPAAIHLAWDGKWDGAIVVAQAVALSTATRGVALLATTAIEAMGRWRLRTLIEIGDGLLLVSAILAAAWLRGPDLEAIAIAVGLQRVTMGIAHVAVAGHAIGSGGWIAVGWLMRFAAPAMVAGLAIESTARLLGLPPDSFASAAIQLAAFGAIWVPLALLRGREEISQLGESMSRRPASRVN